MENLPVIVIRFALYAVLMVLAGLTAFTLYALNRKERSLGLLPLARPALALTLAGLVLTGLGMLALVASMTGSSLLSVDRETMREIVSGTAIGTAWIVRMTAMMAAVAAAIALRRWPTAAHFVLLATTAVAIATLVWTGHAGATEGWIGTVHRLSDIVHMLAASAWIGGIAAFAWMLFRPETARSNMHLTVVHRALDRFSRVGALVVGLILATGIINCLAVVGFPHFTGLPLTPYGKLLIIKLLLFTAMLALAALNRWRLTPALGATIGNGDPAPTLSGLKRSLLAEGTAVVTILALVAWLGTLDPLEAAS
ncbi:copper homeostasis membrane protein CopD [Sphingobium sp. CCH11-B1]|jgi:putative copper resistance protein D|uniref:copper homeostasis membrane protein CopD n=1 Tax=Sphingobium sp. CCH11-B1 TaxID=1768781 RepID=UPI000836AFB5|nr:copper homeostasis membrane protein CopD [Sphingobium sp. CCH11-B1]